MTNPNIDNHRAAVTQADVNEKLTNGLVFQMIFVSSAVAFFNQSWLYFIWSFIGLIIISMIPILSGLMAFVLALMTGCAIYWLGGFFGPGAGITLGFVAFIWALGSNLGGLQYIKDIGR